MASSKVSVSVVGYQIEGFIYRLINLPLLNTSLLSCKETLNKEA